VFASRDALVGVWFAMTVGTVAILEDILTTSFFCWLERELRPHRVLWCQSWLTAWAVSFISVPWAAAYISCPHISLSFRGIAVFFSFLRGQSCDTCSVPPHR
jgi:hypothetical protein